jgi:hypothetical protein
MHPAPAVNELYDCFALKKDGSRGKAVLCLHAGEPGGAWRASGLNRQTSNRVPSVAAAL